LPTQLRLPLRHATPFLQLSGSSIGETLPNLRKLHTTNTTGTMDSQSSSNLLAIPPEIRNLIYGSVFATSGENKVPLQAAEEAAPEKALTLTCRKIYS